MPNIGTINRGLVSLVGITLLILSAAFFKDAQTILATIQLVSGFVVLIFPSVPKFYQQPWFQRRWITGVLSALVIATFAAFIFVPQLGKPNLSIGLITGQDAAGICSNRCTVTIMGSGVSSLTQGQKFAVYGPQVRKVEDGQYAEAPIGVIQVLEIQADNALAQVLLIHETVATDPSKRFTVGELVIPLGTSEPHFLVPAFGEGYAGDTDVVFLRPNTPVNVGDQMETMTTELHNGQIMDHIASGTTLEVIGVGVDGEVVQTKLISGTMSVGDIVRIKPVTLKQFELTPDRRILLNYCTHAKHHWLTFQQIAPTISGRVLFPDDARHGDYGETNTCRSAQVASDVHEGDLIEFGIGVSNSLPNLSLSGTTWYRVQCCSKDGELIRK